MKVASVRKVGRGVARTPEVWSYYTSFQYGIVGLNCFVMVIYKQEQPDRVNVLHKF